MESTTDPLYMIIWLMTELNVAHKFGMKVEQLRNQVDSAIKIIAWLEAPGGQLSECITMFYVYEVIPVGRVWVMKTFMGLVMQKAIIKETGLVFLVHKIFSEHCN